MVLQKVLCLFVCCVLIDAIQAVPVQSKDHAKAARKLVHKADWTAFATISSTFKNFEGFPMVSVKSVADSPRGGKSTGEIYFYLTDLDFSAKDLKQKNNVTVLFTNEQDLSCSSQGIDPMEPTCDRVSISGSAVEVYKNTEEHEYAKKAFISRHPAASIWIQVHRFILYKVHIKNIVVLDGYGGLHIVTPNDYYAVSADEL